MNNTSVYIELDGVEFEIEFEYSYYYQPAKLSGPWEESHPEEGEFTYEVFTPTYWLNATEAWEFMEIDEEVFWDAALNDAWGIEGDYDPMWDNERDYLIDENLGC